MSKYADIAQSIRDAIKSGTYQPGEALPEQKNMAATFHTSRMTLQKALDLLKTEGYLFSQQGGRTYVKYNAESIANLDVGVDEYVGTTELLGKQHKITSEVIRFELRYPNEEEQQKLAIAKNEAIYDIVRSRFVDGVAYGLEYTKMPVALIPGIDESVLKHSIYQYIERDLGLQIGAAFRQIQAQKSTADDIAYLNNQVDDPTLSVTNVVYLEDGRPFEYSTTHQKYDKAHFSVFLPGRSK